MRFPSESVWYHSPMELIKRLIRHLDPRVPFTQSRNTAVQISYIGLASQSALLLYLVFHFLSAPAKISLVAIVFDLIACLSILDMGVSFLKGRKMSQLWGGVFCVIQSLYYFGMLVNHHNVYQIPHTVVLFGFFSCVGTASFLFSKSTKKFIAEYDQNFFN